jgi:acyl carrier protein
MKSDEILQIVTQLFRDVLDIPDLVLRGETTAKEVDGWDSLSHVQLVVAVEKRFKLRFSAREIRSFKNVGEMCDAVARLSEH